MSASSPSKNDTAIGVVGPQYPAIKLNVSQYEVTDILEESVEERQQESLADQKTSKIKKILSSPPKAPPVATL
jgi:hypothetical protein